MSEADPKPEEAPKFLTKDEMEAMLAAQEQKFTGMFTRLVETLTPPKGPQPKGEEDERKPVNFYEKPEEAANALFEQKMAPMRDMYVANEKARQMAEIAALPLPKGKEEEYRKEIEAVIASAPPLVQAHPGFAKEAYNLVRGRHFEEFKKIEVVEKPAPEFTETVTAGAPASRKSEALSATEREAANGMGISEEEYKQWRDNPDKMAAAAMAPQKKAS
jgi:hypothetical protein